MKKQNILLLIVLITNIAISQTLIDVNKKWNTIIKGPPYNPFPTEFTETIKIGQDTIIDTFTYQKVLRSTEEFPATWDVYCFIRETINKEIFIRTDTSTQEYLLYDFSAVENDTLIITGIESITSNWGFYTDTMVVSSLDSIYIAGKYRNRINLGGEQWIEGIGSMTGILHNFFGLVGGNWFELVCFSENDTLKYQNQSYSSCYNDNTSSKDILKEIDVLVYPNPFTDNLVVSVNGENEFLFEMFDISGVKIYSEKVNAINVFDFSEIASGFYIYRISENFKIIKSGKIIKK